MKSTPEGGNAHLFVSHRNSYSLVREFLKIRAAAGENTTFWAHDTAAEEPAPTHPDIPVFEFNADSLSRTYESFLGDAIRPGNAHFVALDFWRRNPSFDHYWFIEYDVRFAGDWSELFGYFRDNPSDFLSAHVRRYRPESSWYWWGHLEHPTESIPPSRRVKSFNPVFRISNHALSVIDRCHRDGWSGHYEVLLPTLLQANDCVIEDFGGSGEFVPPERRNRFYSRHRLFKNTTTGTHRFVPPKAFAGIRRNTIYHPVKPLSDVVRYHAGAIRRRLSRWIRRLLPGR